MTEILEASRSYERTIRELKDEIRQLQQDRVKLNQQQVDLSANTNSNTANGGTRLKKELEENSSAVSDKLKLLRLKEIEFRKLRYTLLCNITNLPSAAYLSSVCSNLIYF